MKVLSLILTAALLVLANQLAADLKRQGLLPATPNSNSTPGRAHLHPQGERNSNLGLP